MSNASDPFEVLAFIDGYTNMPSEKWRARFPEWSAMIDKARARYLTETDYGNKGWARSNVLVNSGDQAVHHWVFLPLIQAAQQSRLNKEQAA